MRKRFFLAAALIASVAGARPASAQRVQFVVVVNAANPVSNMAPRELSRIFRKEVTRWSDGRAIAPVDLPVDAAARTAFSERVHGKPAQAMFAYWQQQIFSGRAVPPVERKNDAEVIDYVRTHPDAIGYVAAGASLPSEVKAITVQ